MRFAVSIVALIALVGCVPPGQFHCGHNEAVNFEPGAPVDDVCPYVDRIYAAAQKACGQDPEIDRLRITVMGRDFMCGDRMVHGCAAWPVGIYVHDRKTLPDEIGHLAWMNCFHRTGEFQNAQGRTEYDPDFQAFVNSLQE